MIKPLVPFWFRKFFRDEQYSDAVDFFRSIPIFHGLTSRQLGRVMLAMQRRHYRAGEKLFEEGQVGKAVFILESGKVELTRKVGDEDRSLGVLVPGHLFGEMALLEEMKRTASATMIEDGEIYLLYMATLNALIQRHPSIGVKLLRNMAIMLSALLRRTNQELDRRMKAEK